MKRPRESYGLQDPVKCTGSVRWRLCFQPARKQGWSWLTAHSQGKKEQKLQGKQNHSAPILPPPWLARPVISVIKWRGHEVWDKAWESPGNPASCFILIQVSAANHTQGSGRISEVPGEASCTVSGEIEWVTAGPLLNADKSAGVLKGISRAFSTK